MMYKLAVSGQPAEGSVLPERISYMSCFRLFKPQGLFAISCRLIWFQEPLSQVLGRFLATFSILHTGPQTLMLVATTHSIL